MPVKRVAIIGGGEATALLLGFLKDDPHVQMVGVAEADRLAPAVILCNQLNVSCYDDYRDLLRCEGLDVVMATVEDMRLEHHLESRSPSSMKLLMGPSLKFITDHLLMLAKKKKRVGCSLEELLDQYEMVHDMAFRLAASQDLSRILYYTVENATRLMNTPAGSVSLYDEWNGEMYLGTTRGFGEQFSKAMRWPVRIGGLTSSILNSVEPTIIPDVLQHPEFDNPAMLQEGIRSLMAAPLIAEERIIGILYVDDFVVRQFTARESALLSLLGSVAAAMIERVQLFENAMRISITDDLTGLVNHRYFTQRLSTEIRRSDHYHLVFTLVMIDIDDFRKYNDTYGHPKGNEVLRQMGALLMDNFRDVDIISRYWGGKFAVIMPEISSEVVFQTLNRFLGKVWSYPFEGREKMPGGRVTVSLGVASYPIHAKETQRLIECAEVALALAKQQGKNRVVVCKTTEAGREEVSEEIIPHEQTDRS